MVFHDRRKDPEALAIDLAADKDKARRILRRCRNKPIRRIRSTDDLGGKYRNWCGQRDKHGNIKFPTRTQKTIIRDLERHQKRMEKIAKVIAMIEQNPGCTVNAIAPVLGINVGGLSSLITDHMMGLIKTRLVMTDKKRRLLFPLSFSDIDIDHHVA